MTTRFALAVAFATFLAAGFGSAQTPAPVDLKTNIGNLGSLDFMTRMNAARMIRRAPSAEAVTALTDAVRRQTDEFVRYRALVLLTAFNDRGTADLMPVLMQDRNDRVREVAYEWIEQHPDSKLTPALLNALRIETAEFVRPALVSALAAVKNDTQVERAMLAEVSRGLDFFRSAVIDALGRHRAAYAVNQIAGVLALDGPLRDDAVLALGRIGGPAAGKAIAELKNVSPDLSLRIRGAQCLMGQSCEEHIKALSDAAVATDVRPDVPGAAVEALAAIAENGNASATAALMELAARGGALRDRVAFGFAGVAVRRPDAVITWLDAAPERVRAAAIDLLKDGFDSLEEDFAEEQFFAAARAAYWKASDGSATRTLTAALIQKLEF